MSKVHVFNIRKARLNLNNILQWCKEVFGDINLVHGPTSAELYRVCYDNQVTGIVVFYFKEDTDYSFFLLRWGNN